MGYEKHLKFIKETAAAMVKGCCKKAFDGTNIYTPDGCGNYDAMWCRDYAYMVENAGDLFDEYNVKKGIEYLIGGVRESDGWGCDWRNAQGMSSYSPCGQANLDNMPFLVIAARSYIQFADEGHGGVCASNKR